MIGFVAMPMIDVVAEPMFRGLRTDILLLVILNTLKRLFNVHTVSRFGSHVYKKLSFTSEAPFSRYQSLH
jgi:hypothetical protein